MLYIRKKLAIQVFYLVFDSGVYAALQEHRVKDIIVPRNYEDGTYGAKMLFHESYLSHVESNHSTSLDHLIDHNWSLFAQITHFVQKTRTRP